MTHAGRFGNVENVTKGHNIEMNVHST